MNESIPSTRSMSRRLPRFSGNKGLSHFNPRDIDAVIMDRLDALSNIEVRYGSKLGAVLSDHRVIITIPQITATAGGGINPRLEFDPTKIYNYLDLVFISAGSNQGAFLYVNKAASLGADHPPYAGGNFWVSWPGSAPLGQWM